MRTRIYADFNKSDADKNSTFLILECRGTLEDLKKNGITLREGLKLTFYADDADDCGIYDELEADGVCHFESDSQRWVGRINGDAVRHASDLQRLSDHIVRKNPQGIQSSEARKLMLCLYCTLSPLPEELRSLKLTKEALANIFSRLAAEGRITPDEGQVEIPAELSDFEYWEELAMSLFRGTTHPDYSFLEPASRYV